MDSLNILRGVLMFCHNLICPTENSFEVNLKTYINSARVYGFRDIFPPKADGWMAGDTPR